MIDVLIVSSGMLTGLAMTGLSPVLPAIERSFHGVPGGGYLVKMVLAVVGLAIMCASPVAALLARRFACGPILATAFSGYALAAVGSSLAPSLAWLIVSRFVQGACVAVGITVVLGLNAALYSGAARARRIGLHMGLSALALMALLPAVGRLGDIGWRFAPLFGLLSLVHLSLVLAARSRLQFRLSPSQQGRPPLDAAQRRSVATMVMLALLVGIATYSSPAFVPFKLASVGVRSAAMVGVLSTLSVATSAVSSLGYGAVRARLAGRAVYLVGFALGAGGMVATGLGQSVQVAAAGMAVSGLGGGLLVAHIYGDCAERFASDLIVWMTGLVKASGFAGLFLGPLLIQALVERSSISAAFHAIAAMMIVAAITAILRPAAPIAQSI